MFNSVEYDNEIKAIRKRERCASRPMTANEWRCCDGGAEPKSCSFETIFDAYHDYRNSQQWN